MFGGQLHENYTVRSVERPSNAKKIARIGCFLTVR